MPVIIQINDAVEFSANGGVHVRQCAIDMDPIELHAAIRLAFHHMNDTYLKEACCGGHNLLNDRADSWHALSFDQYIAICSELDIQEATRAAKRKFTGKRRSQYAKARADLVLGMIESGVPYVCNHEGCDVTEDLTIDHITPLSRGGSDDLANLQFLCRAHNSQKGDSVESAERGVLSESAVEGQPS